MTSKYSNLNAFLLSLFYSSSQVRESTFNAQSMSCSNESYSGGTTSGGKLRMRSFNRRPVCFERYASKRDLSSSGHRFLRMDKTCLIVGLSWE